jgi:hypothetical protein
MSGDDRFIEGLEGRRLLAATGFRFVTKLTGAEEVPVRETQGRGSATFKVNREGTEIRYTLKGNKIRNVVDAHIHLGPRGENGAVVVDLLPAPVTGTRPRFAVRGVITGAALTGPLAGMTLFELVAAMRQNNTYVNVHTSDGVAPADTGPGDFPGGEIRGQVRPVGRAARPDPAPGQPTGGQPTGGQPTGGQPGGGQPGGGQPNPYPLY